MSHSSYGRYAAELAGTANPFWSMADEDRPIVQRLGYADGDIIVYTLDEGSSSSAASWPIGTQILFLDRDASGASHELPSAVPTLGNLEVFGESIRSWISPPSEQPVRTPRLALTGSWYGDLQGYCLQRRSPSGHLTSLEATRRLDDFSRLPPNWDSYGADPISETAIQRTRELLDHLKNLMEGVAGEAYLPSNIAPIADGGVQLEWQAQTRDLEIEVAADGTISSFALEGRGDQRATASEKNLAYRDVARLVAPLVTAIVNAAQSGGRY